MSTYVKQLYSHLGVHPQIIALPRVTARQVTSELHLRRQLWLEEPREGSFPCCLQLLTASLNKRFPGM